MSFSIEYVPAGMVRSGLDDFCLAYSEEGAEKLYFHARGLECAAGESRPYAIDIHGTMGTAFAGPAMLQLRQVIVNRLIDHIENDRNLQAYRISIEDGACAESLPRDPAVRSSSLRTAARHSYLTLHEAQQVQWSRARFWKGVRRRRRAFFLWSVGGILVAMAALDPVRWAFGLAPGVTFAVALTIWLAVGARIAWSVGALQCPECGRATLSNPFFSWQHARCHACGLKPVA